MKFEMEDDDLQLPADTLAILAQFKKEMEIYSNLQEQGAVISEDWQLSQFWYDAETSHKLCNEAIRACNGQGSIACLSSPTLMKYFCDKEEVKNGSIRVSVLEYDERFRLKHPNEYVFYDYRHPLDINEALHHTFDVIVADPPFLSEECLSKTSQTIKLLGKPNSKVILCTGAIMENLAKELLNVDKTEFYPKHVNNLANDFSCFTNFKPELLN